MSFGIRSGARLALYFVMLVGLFLFVGLRFRVGCDWGNYLGHYNGQGQFMAFEDAAAQSEPAYWLLLVSVIKLELPYPWLNIATAAIFFTGLHAVARRQPDPLQYLALSFPVLMVNIAMSATRQTLAMGVLYFALLAFIEMRTMRYCLLVLLATAFHNSAVIFFALAPLIGHITRDRIMLAVLMSGPLLVVLGSSSLADQYTSAYVGTDMEAAGAPYRVGLLFLTGLLQLFVLRKKWAKVWPRDNVLVLIGSITMLLILPITFYSSVIGDRFAYYLIPIQLMTLSRAPLLYSNQNRSLLTFAPQLLLGVFLLVWTTYSSMFALCYSNYQVWGW